MSTSVLSSHSKWYVASGSILKLDAVQAFLKADATLQNAKVQTLKMGGDVTSFVQPVGEAEALQCANQRLEAARKQQPTGVIAVIENYVHCEANGQGERVWVDQCLVLLCTGTNTYTCVLLIAECSLFYCSLPFFHIISHVIV